MKKFSPKQIKECKDYLESASLKGFMSENSAQDLIRTENWEEVYNLMLEGNHWVNK